MSHRILKLSAIAIAFSAIAAQAHAADGVTIYGTIDAGVRAATNQPTAKGTIANKDSGTETSVVSGGLQTSRIGFKGSEDLGSGLKAVFQLEAGLNIANGDTDAGGILFNRLSHVGLVKGDHAVYVGREYTTTYRLMSELDPLAFSAPSINPNLQAASLNDLSYYGNNLPGQTDARANSAVRYDGKFGRLNGSLQYGFGGAAGDTSARSSYGAQATYDLGTVLIGAGAARMNGDVDNKINVYNVGAKWAYTNNLSLSATYTQQSAEGGLLDGIGRHVTSIGAFYTPSRVTYGVAFYDTRASGNGASGKQEKLVGLASYNFTKRTSLYGTVDYAHNKDVFVPATTGEASSLGLTVGVNHSF